jgi:putative lipoprotein
MEQESRFLAALEAAGVYQIDGERLHLRADNGSLLVDLVSAVAEVLKMPEGATLPPDASVRIQIQDVSLADAPAKVIGEQILSSTGTEATAGFEVEFDPAVIDPDDSYTVSARVTDPEDKLLFVSTSSHPVITRGSPQLNVSVDLEAAR